MLDCRSVQSCHVLLIQLVGERGSFPHRFRRCATKQTESERSSETAPGNAPWAQSSRFRLHRTPDPVTMAESASPTFLIYRRDPHTDLPTRETEACLAGRVHDHRELRRATRPASDEEGRQNETANAHLSRGRRSQDASSPTATRARGRACVTSSTSCVSRMPSSPDVRS